MKFRMLLVAAAMLMFAALSYGQAWTVITWEEDGPLTTRCGAGVPIPDGEGFIAMYMDADMDGPDDTDPLAPGGGVAGGLWANPIPFNWGVGEGMYWGDPAFQTNGGLLQPVNRVYIRVLWPTIENWTVRYTSTSIWSPAAAAIIEEELDWTCEEITVNPCTQTASVNLVPTSGIGPQVGVHACFDMCIDGAPIPVCVGPLVRDNRIPIVHFASTGCEDCVFIPAALGGPWVWTVIGGLGYYCNTLINPSNAEGCANIVLDAILPVELTSFTATPSDGEVVVAWTTRSENGLSAFEVIRDGAKVFEVAANNVATTSEYKFVDADAENGRTYSYELVVVNADGSRESLTTASATPSYDAAVITEYALHQNFPNPFNPTTSITFDLVDAKDVTITVYNAMGQQVASMMNGQNVKAGRHTLSFDATNLTSGLYFYTIKAGNDFTATKKMLLVK